ncbi:Ca2+:H+ antiporter [Angomonas deanei]|nr:Ca2+:H+ antiporter [Angomonas deanei]|eukprot:EPY36179.1 Ca2+:H+ antiporter [Angomonas deanei]
MGEERFACYVRTVMIGSILLHLLLVLGVSVVFTPMAEDQTVFGLQMLGSFGEGMRFCLILFMFPTLYEYMIAIPDFERSADTTTPLKQEQNVLLISRLLCACALPAYLLYLVNTIRSRYFDADGRLHFPTNWWYALTYYHTVHSREGIARGAHSEPRFTRSVALWGFSIFQTIEVLLCGVVACTLLPAARACALPLPFVLVVLIPLSFNAGELASSFLFSREGRVDMGASIAFHCMIDMVMWVMPVVVLFAWTMGRSLDLSCHPYLVSVCFFSVMIVSTEGSASRMRRLLGVMLLSLYALLVCTCLMGGWHLCQKKSYTKPTFHTTTQKKGK